MSTGGRSSRRRHKVKTYTDPGITTNTKWSEKEVGQYLECIMRYGHKNLNKLKLLFPDKSPEVIKTFLRTAFDQAIRAEEVHPNLDGWLKHCRAVNQSTPWKDCLQIAQVFKYLSVDGLIENHPLPSQCQGINFPEAYRLIYQALLGYPMQSVNKETADFVSNTFKDLSAEMKKEVTCINNVSKFLKIEKKVSERKVTTKENDTSSPESIESTKKEDFKKSLKVYQRKKPKLSVENSETPLVKIYIEENKTANTPNGTKDFSVTIDKKNTQTVINVPVPVKMNSILNMDTNEQELLKSTLYNPFKIPENWLQEPFYVNLRMNCQ